MYSFTLYLPFTDVTSRYVLTLTTFITTFYINKLYALATLRICGLYGS